MNTKIKEKRIGFQWEENEFVKTPKNKKWLYSVCAFFLAVFLLALLLKNFFLAFLILMAGFSFLVHALKTPRVYSFKINKNGVSIGRRTLISLEEIKSFWIFKNPGSLPDELSLILKRKINPGLKIPIHPSQNTREIRYFLKGYLLEKRQEKTLTEVFLERIGF